MFSPLDYTSMNIISKKNCLIQKFVCLGTSKIICDKIFKWKSILFLQT